MIILGQGKQEEKENINCYSMLVISLGQGKQGKLSYPVEEGIIPYLEACTFVNIILKKYTILFFSLVLLV